MQPQNKKKLRQEMSFIVGLILFLIVFYVISRSPHWVEHIYSHHLFPLMAITGHFLWAWVPFSIGDLLYILLGLLLLIQFYRGFKALFKRRYLLTLFTMLKTVRVLLCLLVLFYLFWGLNYFRLPLEQRMGLDLRMPEPCELWEVTALCIDKANTYRVSLEDTALRDDGVVFDRAAFLMTHNREMKPYLFSYRPLLKKPLTNFFGNYMMVSGYFNPFTQESQMNTAMPWFTKPFTACHELAHQAGIAFEDEANLVGFILCVDSQDTLFRYSAYYNALFMLMREIYVHYPGRYAAFVNMISPAVKADMQREYQYWHRFAGPINDAQTLFYDQYLQLNNQPEGINRYNRMTKLLIAWRKNNATRY